MNKKKNLFPAKQKTAQFFLFLFCFIRELNLYSPLTSALTSAYPSANVAKLIAEGDTETIKVKLRGVTILGSGGVMTGIVTRLALPRVWREAEMEGR